MKKGWEIRPLGSVAKVGAGNSAPQDKDLFTDGKYPFFRTSDVGKIRIGKLYDAVDFLNNKGIKKLRAYSKGTILIPKSGASTFLNHRVIMGVDGYVSSHLATIIPDPNRINEYFLLYYLIGIKAQDLIQDQNYPSLKLSDINNINIPTPPLNEQKRIVAILDKCFEAIDKAKANVERNLQNAKELFQSKLNQIFSQKGDGWVEKKLEEVVDKTCSLSYGIVQPGSDVSDGLPIVRPVDLSHKVIYLQGLKRIDPLLADAYKRTTLLGDELLLCVRGSTGTVSIASEELTGSNVTRGIVPIRFDTSIISQQFGYFQLISRHIQSQIKAKTYGTALMQINIRDLRKVSIVVAPAVDQNTITQRLSRLTEKVTVLEKKYQQELDALNELKKSILQKAFNGELT